MPSDKVTADLAAADDAKASYQNSVAAEQAASNAKAAAEAAEDQATNDKATAAGTLVAAKTTLIADLEAEYSPGS